VVASIMAYSLSGSEAKALKRFSQTPFSAQREKRRWVLFQSPKRSGKSRHGATERNFQITASTNSRLQTTLSRPTWPGRPEADSLSGRTDRREVHNVSSESLLFEVSL
jgi:hypothetical protein